MKYVALLRGVNVGGNNKIKMADLKLAVEKAGYDNVVTFIQSGNILFDADQSDRNHLAEDIERVIRETFHIHTRVVIRSLPQMKKIVSMVPKSWATDTLRKYVAFIKEPVTAETAAKEIPVREGIDFMDVGDGVLYMATKMEGLTKSGYTKIVGMKIYRDMTMRNINTTQKILALMEK